MNQSINILIVDDEPKNLTVLETVLDVPGYRLVRAESADQALLALVVEEFALLILDIRMPGMTGFELAQMIKERKKTARVPIIFLTAYYNEDQHVLEGYETGAVDYLHKPVNAAVLRSKVAVFAELHRKTREVGMANRALLAEVTERRRAEERLRELNETLEQRVTERTDALRASEERVRAIYDGTFEYLGLLTPDGTLREANRASLEFAGSRREDVIGRPFWETVWFQFTPGAPDVVRQAIVRAAMGEIVGFESLMITPAGETKTFELSFRPICDDRGEVTFLVLTGLDVTDRKHVEQVLKDSDRRKDEFLATLAHELRNPLAPVRNAVQLLKMKDLPIPELQWARDVIDRQTQAMTRLIDDLMDVSRINQGKVELKRERVELTKVVQVAVETSGTLIEQMGHELTVALPPRPIVIDADPTRLAQVFLNLLNNAAKYTGQGGRIELRAEQEGSDVVVSVRDTGIGIPTNKLSSIFEMFSQVEGALSRSQGGLGIGLCLVKRLVEMHGGSIEAHSDGPGKGCEFVVRLPIVVEQTYVRRVNDDEKATPTSELRILVVDDNRDAASSLAVLLKRMGNNVRTVHDGEAAVAAAGEFRPHVVLCDIGLPKLNGYEACRQMREGAWNKDMVLIAVSGWGQDEDRRKSGEAGFNRHMVKPVDSQSLMKLLAELNVVKVRNQQPRPEDVV